MLPEDVTTPVVFIGCVAADEPPPLFVAAEETTVRAEPLPEPTGAVATG